MKVVSDGYEDQCGIAESAGYQEQCQYCLIQELKYNRYKQVQIMNEKPTYEEMEQRIKYLEKLVQEQEKNEGQLLEEIRELTQTKKYYDILMQNTIDYFLICDNNGIPQAFNESYKKKVEELINREMRPGLQPRKLSKDPEAFKYWDSLQSRALKGEKFTAEYIDKSNEYGPLYYETIFCPIKEAQKITGFTEITRNITKRKRSEEELKKLQAQLSNTVEMAHLGPWEYDIATDTFTFNDYFYKVLHTTAEEVGGYKMKPEEYAKRFLHPDDMARVRKEIQKPIKVTDTDFKRRLEHRIIYPDGTIGHISVQIFIVKDAQGKTIKTYGVNQDITERKKIEAELHKSQKLESLGTLAGGIAHDFNNILTVILGNVSMAGDLVNPESEIFELLGDVETASKRAQRLTKQLLIFAKGGTPVKETATIKDIIKESSLFVTRGSKSSCEFSIAEDLWPVEVDVGQLSQVIHSIVVNANQAMPDGGVIHIQAENHIKEEGDDRQLKPGRYVRLSVKDKGIGIAEKHLSKIFDPYFTTKQDGSGLGLATAYSIIKKHNGMIMAESLLGTGTEVNIYLPAAEKTIPEKKEVNLITGKGKILVMDDEEPLRKLVGKLLERLGYEAEYAKDGEEAVAIYKAAKESGKPFDVVILDLTVPGRMGGKESIQKMLEIDPEVKAIVSSGYSDDPVLANYMKYGFKGMIAKPFELKLLSRVLHDLLHV